jgi:hypothetical protein
VFADTLLAFIWAPAVLYLVSLGMALLADRVLTLDLPNALLAPVGVALLVVLVMPLYKLGADAGIAVAFTLVAVAAGYGLSFRTLGARINPGAVGLAGLAAYALYLAPVALSGHWSWPGYDFVNDTSSNFVFTDLLAHHGVTLPTGLESTTTKIAAHAVSLGYPLGAHGVLATMTPLTGAPLAAVYHPLIATAAALAAMTLAHLARGAGFGRWSSIAAGILPLGAVLLYRYALHGAVKEVFLVSLLATTCAIAREALDRGLRVRFIAVMALCVAAMLQVFSGVGAAYGLVLGIGLLAAGAAEGVPLRAIGRLAAAGLAIGLVAVVVNLSDAKGFVERASDTFANSGGASTAYLGQLVRPLPLEQAAGVWLTADYRGPVAPGLRTENAILIAVVVGLALVGVALELRRRRPTSLLILVPTALVAAVLAPRLAPYADAKLLVLLTPAIVFAAALGALELMRSGPRPVRLVGIVAAVAATGGILLSDAYGYRQVQLAPPDRVEAMEDAADHAQGGGLWLVNEWEEFAKYFMRDIRVNAAFEAESPKPVDLRKPAPIFGQYFDLDDETLEYLLGFQGIIKRRSPDASRPPASFDVVYANDYYEVWRRQPGTRVLAHLPLQSAVDATAFPRCRDVRRLAGGARPGQRLVAAARPEPVMLSPRAAPDRPAGWVDGDKPGIVVPTSPGEVSGARTTRGGRFRVWIAGSFGRPTAGYVDGRRIGAADQINGPGQWLEVGTVRLPAGRHELRLRRPGRSLGPGDGVRGQLGPLVLEPIEASRLVSVAPSEAARLCRRQWDWIEVVDR